MVFVCLHAQHTLLCSELREVKPVRDDERAHHEPRLGPEQTVRLPWVCTAKVVVRNGTVAVRRSLRERKTSFAKPGFSVFCMSLGTEPDVGRKLMVVVEPVITATR